MVNTIQLLRDMIAIPSESAEEGPVIARIKKEMESMREEMKKIADMPDSAEKKAAQEQLAQRLNSLADGMKQVANSPQLQAALLSVTTPRMY